MGGTRDTGLVTVDNLFENPARYIYIHIIMHCIYIYIPLCIARSFEFEHSGIQK